MGGSVGDAIIDFLRLHGITRIYGIIGTSVLDFYDALYRRRGEVRAVTTRHEQVAVSMADAEARVTGRPGAAVVHAGPGFLNTMISLGIAYKDRVPLILISGGVRRRLRGANSWLEVDQKGAASPLTRYYGVVRSPESLADVLYEASEALSGAVKGPVAIEVPEDLWGEGFSAPKGFYESLPVKERARPPSRDEVERVAGLLQASKRPLILACREVARRGVWPLLEEVALRVGAYIAVTGNARGSCPEDSERCLGRAGFGGGNTVADSAMASSDYLLVLGSEFDDVTTYAYTNLPEGEVTVVSLDPDVASRPSYYELVEGDPWAFLSMLRDYLAGKGVSLVKGDWDSTIKGFRRSWESMLSEAVRRRYEGYVNPSRFFHALNKRLPRDRIVTGGQGTHILYPYDYVEAYEPGQFLAATNLGAMGYALPAAMGAKLAKPGSTVVSVVGDGELMMVVQDLETIRRLNLGVKVVVVNDDSYRVLLLRQRIQKQGRVFETVLGNPDFVKLGESFGIRSMSIRSDNEVEESIEEMLRDDEPFLLELKISREDLPPLNLDATLRMSMA